MAGVTADAAAELVDAPDVKAVAEQPAISSIYDVLGPRKQQLVLLVAASVSLMLPFSDTVYLPALNALQRDLQTTASLTAASVAIYM